LKKIVIDENMSLSDKELKNNPEFANTKHEVGLGAKYFKSHICPKHGLLRGYEAQYTSTS